MEVALDQGLYHHLRFRKPGTGLYMPNGLRSRGALIDTAGYIVYRDAVPKHRTEAARLRQAAAELEAESKHPLPPTIAALAATEADRLAKAIARRTDRSSTPPPG